MGEKDSLGPEELNLSQEDFSKLPPGTVMPSGTTINMDEAAFTFHQPQKIVGPTAEGAQQVIPADNRRLPESKAEQSTPRPAPNPASQSNSENQGKIYNFGLDGKPFVGAIDAQSRQFTVVDSQGGTKQVPFAEYASQAQPQSQTGTSSERLVSPSPVEPLAQQKVETPAAPAAEKPIELKNSGNWIAIEAYTKREAAGKGLSFEDYVTSTIKNDKDTNERYTKIYTGLLILEGKEVDRVSLQAAFATLAEAGFTWQAIKGTGSNQETVTRSAKEIQSDVKAVFDQYDSENLVSASSKLKEVTSMLDIDFKVFRAMNKLQQEKKFPKLDPDAFLRDNRLASYRSLYTD